MGIFILRRVGVMVLTALCLTFVVFFLTNLYPNLEKLAKTQGNMRMTDEQVEQWLANRGYLAPMPIKYGQWLGVLPGWTYTDAEGNVTGRCIEDGVDPAEAPTFCGVLQGDWGYSTVFRENVGEIVLKRLGLTGILMFWVMVLMVPGALIIGVLAGMREGSRLDRTLSTVSITTTATPEYVSGVIFIAVFASSAVGLKWFKGTATSAMDDITFENFFLPVLTIALYGMGYIARMTRASMAEVMTAQYIRTARLKGVSFPNIVLRHALRNALIAPFTVIMLQFPWLLNGVVIVETLFNYKGFGWTLVQAAGNNDIELLLGVSVVSVFVVLVTQLISDIGYVYLNPRIRIAEEGRGMDALSSFEIFMRIVAQLTPVWIALIATFTVSFSFKRKLGLYGKLFDSVIGMIGFGLVMFWVFTAIFGAFDLIVTHDALTQISGMKNKVPGTPISGAEEEMYQYYLLGGDNLARDVFSRVIKGAWVVVQIAPLATLFAFMVGITLGLPAGYYGGRLDTVLSFLANLILAFPVILLFYLLVTPEIVATGIPNYMAAFMFIFPIIFAGVLLNSRYHTQPRLRTPLLIGVLGVMAWLYLSLISEPGSKLHVIPRWMDGFDVPGGILVVFVSVVFVNSPTVFRIVRGLALDIKTRDYVAAAQTRGEGAWYIMLWEILPNARGPLIVDFCLRVGYTTILLGTLGFFGLGLPPESPDWGSTINEGRKLLSIYLHPALPPALALLSLVLGLNLLADGLREESLKD